MVFPFNNPPQFNVQKQLNKNIIIINWISFNNGPGAEKKEKRYKVVALSSQHFWWWLLVISKSTCNHRTSLNSSSHDVSDPFLIKLDKKTVKKQYKDIVVV